MRILLNVKAINKKYQIICKRNNDRGQSLTMQDSLGSQLTHYCFIFLHECFLFYCKTM